MTLIVSRFEDMSPTGGLTLFIQDDGDVIVQITTPPNRDSDFSQVSSVEFCIPGGGGGGSSKTHKALQALAVAMAEDNKDGRCVSRAGEFTGEEILARAEANRREGLLAGLNPDEPWFLIRGQDKYAPQWLGECAEVAYRHGLFHLSRVIVERARKMSAWQDDNPEKIKVLDLKEGEQ